LVDLLPTLLGWLLPVDAETGTAPAVLAQLEGASLLPVLRNRGVPPGVAFSEAGSYPRHFRSVQDQQWKLVLRPPPQGAPVSNRDFELYDLNADPAESVNLIAEKSDELARLRRLLLQERCASATSAQPQPQRPRGAAEIRALQALGYLDELEEAVAEGEGLETPVAAD
jgi:arylsulfatase A-like enzyme